MFVGRGVAVGGRGVDVFVGGSGVAVRVGCGVAVCGGAVGVAVRVGVGGSGVGVAVSIGVGVLVALGGLVGDAVAVGSTNGPHPTSSPHNKTTTAAATIRRPVHRADCRLVGAPAERWDWQCMTGVTGITFPLREDQMLI